MGHIASEVKSAIARTGIHAEVLDLVQLLHVRGEVQSHFIEPDGEGPLWEKIRDDVSVRAPEGWRWISSVPLVGRAILFFEAHDESSGFVFNSGTDVVSVLAESTGFEFYLTDEKTSFLVAFNHHDYLSATGSAAEWLLALMRSR